MKKRQLFLIPVSLVLLFGVFAFGLSLNNSPSGDLGDAIHYNSMVKIETTGDFDGRTLPIGEWELVSLHPNQIYDTGKEGIEASLGTGSADAYDWIELGDAGLAVGAVTAGKTEAYTAHAADGLSEVAGTIGSNAPSGNWTVYTEFTSTATNQLTNISRLRNAAGVDLAGAIFALTNLSNGDKLNLTWDIWIV